VRLTGVRGGASAASSAESFEAALAALEKASAAFAAEASVTRPFWPSFKWEDPPTGASGANGYEIDDDAPPLPSEDRADIARELALEALNSEAALQRARRRFMWANHPDRRPEWPRELATRRVALANMLIDKALRRLRLARSPA